MQSSNDGSNIKTVGNRIRYIEPNYNISIPMQGPRGLHSYEFENPLEDYCIFINLKVEVRGRAIRTDYVTENKTYTLNYYSEQGKEAVSFLQGSKYPNAKHNVYGKDNYSLTTDYTNHLYINDLISRDINGKVTSTDATTELFGINSIDIEYNNWMAPEVTIKFTDVRGASVFAPEEARHNVTDSNNIGGVANENVEGSFFKCFFTFPYPKFTLCVKGFYGEPVAYELAVEDFRASFNSDTGNFEATAKFIGYSYSFLGDVMMNALTAAPYSDYLGKNYWDENIANGRFTVKDVNGQNVPMKTIGEIITKLDDAISKANAVAQSSTEAQEMRNCEDKNNTIQGIKNAYDAFTNKLNDAYKAKVDDSDIPSYKGFDFSVKDGSNTVIFIPDADASDTLEGMIGPWFGNSDIVNAYDALLKQAKDTPYEDKIKKLNPKEVKATRIYVKGKSGKDVVYTGATSLLGKYQGIMNGITKNRDISNNNANDGETIISDKNLYYGFVFIDNDLGNQLDNDKQSNDTDIQTNQAQMNDVFNESIGESLEFNPSIESIVRIVMAHFETLTYMLTKCARKITGESRTMESLGVTSDNIKDVNVTKKDLIIPPFPKVTKRVNQNGVDKDEEAWVGDFSGDWEEKEIVNGLLNGINEMATIINQAQNGESIESGRLTSVMKIPLNPLDMILDENPYGTVNFNDRSSFAGQVVLRMFSILGLAPEKVVKAVDATTLGKAEAVNFATFFPSPPSEFKKWLDGTDAVSTIESIVNGSASVQTYGKNNLFAWGSASPLCSDWKLSEYKSINGNYVPIQDASFTDIKRKLGVKRPNGTYAYPQHPTDFISTKSLGYVGGSTLTSGKLICIEPNPDRFKTIIEGQLQSNPLGDDVLSPLSEKLSDEATYDGGDFLKKFNNSDSDYIIVYLNQDSTSASTDSDTSTTTNGFSYKYDSSRYNAANEAFFDTNDHKVSDYKVIFAPDSTYQKSSVFATRDYYRLNDDEQAFRFLHGLGFYIDYDTCIEEVRDNNRFFATIPYASILYMGGLCYFGEKIANKQTVLLNANEKKLCKKFYGSADMRTDVKKDLSAYFTKWMKSDFAKINSTLSLKSDDYDGFFEAIEKGYGIETVVAKYAQSLDLNYDSVDKNGGNNVRMIMKPNGYGALMVTELVLSPYTMVMSSDYFNPNTSKNVNIDISNKSPRSFLTGFIEKLKDIYDDGQSDDSTTTELAKDCNTDPDIKIGVYRYLKLLYDKWIAGSVFETDFKMEKFFGLNPDSMDDDHRYFYFIDSYYNKIGNLLLINIGDFKDQMLNCQMQDGYTLLSFLSYLCSKNKCNFLCIQNFMDLGNIENFKRVFNPVSVMDMKTPDVTPNFIIQYTYEPSSHLDINDDGSDYSYPDDSFSIKNGPMTCNGSDINKWPLPLNSTEECGYYIPAFGVSYGKQYQSYFQNVSISMDNPMVTEQSIKAQFQIASMNNENPKNDQSNGTATRNMVTMGQDLFTVYSNNSYTCEVEMMGDAWIQPLMYFELLNVPMFRGTYMIEKVTHHVEAGKMTTHFSGVRMANTTTKLKKGWFWAADPTQTGADDIEQKENALADVTNDCDYAKYPIGGDFSDVNVPQEFIKKDFSNGGKFDNNKQFVCTMYAYWIKYGKVSSTLAAAIVAQEAHECAWGKDRKATYYNYGGVRAYGNHNDGQGWAKYSSIQEFVLEKKRILMKNYPGSLNARTKEEYFDTIQSLNGKGKGLQYCTDPAGAAYKNMILNGTYKNVYNILSKFPKKNVTVNQNSSKQKGIWNDFVASVRQTAMNTPSCGLNIGNEKNQPNSGWITTGHNGTGGADKLGIVFDIILSTYSEYVQELWWVARNNHDNQGPDHLEVVVSEKPKYEKIQVGMKIMGSNTPFTGVNINSNKTYRRAIVKFYSKNGRYKNSDKVGVYGKVVKSKIPVSDWKNLQPTSCTELISGGEDFISGMSYGKWRVSDSVNHAIRNAKAGSTSNCAHYVSNAIDAGGLKSPRGDGYQAALNLQKIGFKIIKQGKTSDSDFASIPFKVGDIMGMTEANYKPSTKNGRKVHVGHICIYCGSQNGWISDFKQKSPYVYSSKGPGTYWLLRYAGNTQA